MRGSIRSSWRPETCSEQDPGCAQSGEAAGLRMSLLLYGPSGSGKATAVYAAAAALGWHVVPFSCRELGGQPQQSQQQGGPDTTSAAALRAAFEAATQFSPALLLLQDFEALLEAIPGGPAPSEAPCMTNP